MRFRITLLAAFLLLLSVAGYAQPVPATGCQLPTDAAGVNALVTKQMSSVVVIPMWGTNQLALIPSDQPITLHVTFKADLPAAPEPSFAVSGTLGGVGEFLRVRSWTPTDPKSSAADAKRSGDIVVDPIAEQKLLTDASTSLQLNVTACVDGKVQTGIANAFVSPHLVIIGVALLFTVLCYVFAALAIPRRGTGRFSRLDPLWLTVDGSGRASLAQMQILFFSIIVLYLVFYILLRTGILASLSQSVLLLLGIAGVGSVGGTLATNNTQRLSFDNWAWIRHKSWTTDAGLHADEPQWRDLFNTNDEFDPYKFQMVSFSFVIGISLLMVGLSGLASFTVPEALLGLIGLSQAAYIGGKIAAPSNFGDLDAKLTELRKAQDDFVASTADKWVPPATTAAGIAAQLGAAMQDNRAKYVKFKELVEPAYESFTFLFKTRGPNPNKEPDPY